jgi:hypothetical protein
VEDLVEQDNNPKAQERVLQHEELKDVTEMHNYKRKRGQTANVEQVIDEELRWRARQKQQDIKSGPFSAVEKRAILESLENSAMSRGLSTTDYSWLIQGPGNRSGEIAGVWKEVAMNPNLRHRTIKSIAATGIRMVHPYARRGPFTSEDDEKLRELVEQKGPKWVEIGAQLKRTREAVRDRWKEIRLGAAKAKGHWKEDEETRLKSAVEEYLKAKTRVQSNSITARGSDPKTQDRRIVLDDIDWELISSRVGTRSGPQCLEKWYDQLSPSMVSRGEWGKGDDRRMLKALWSIRPSADYMVKWENLVKGRTASQTKRRWRLMIKAVSGYREKEFDDILSSLVETYMPHLLHQGKDDLGDGIDNENDI